MLPGSKEEAMLGILRRHRDSVVFKLGLEVGDLKVMDAKNHRWWEWPQQ